MDIRDMEIFLKIAEYENVSRAAAELHIAQPHLTHRLKLLEQDLGTELFTREKKRLHITEEGRYLQQQCRQMLQLKTKTEEQIHQMQDGYRGRIFIGAIETAGTIYLPRWISGFRRKYPSVSYCLWTANSPDVVERMDRGLLDVALIRSIYDRDKFDGIHIRKEAWMVVLSSEHPLASKEGAITFRELAEEPLVVPTSRAEEVRSWFEAEGLRANIMCEFSPLMNAIVLAERNLGVAILPDRSLAYFSDHNVIQKPIEKERFTDLYLIWKKNATLSRSAQHFIDYVREDLAGNETSGN